MKTERYALTKKYKGYEEIIEISAMNKQIRFFSHNICIANIRLKKYKELIGCTINDKTGYVFTLFANKTKYSYTFDTANQAIEKAELMFKLQIPDNIKETFKANELLQRLANKL